MARLMALLILLSGCTVAEDRDMGAVLAPLCFFNCVVSVHYGPSELYMEPYP